MCVLIVFNPAKFRHICVSLQSYKFYVHIFNGVWKLSDTYRPTWRSPQHRHNEMSFYKKFFSSFHNSDNEILIKMVFDKKSGLITF